VLLAAALVSLSVIGIIFAIISIVMRKGKALFQWGSLLVNAFILAFSLLGAWGTLFIAP
jgi:hypothetical protein